MMDANGVKGQQGRPSHSYYSQQHAFEVPIKLLMYLHWEMTGCLLDPRLTLTLNMQSFLFIAALATIIMGLNI